jgi:hypothetical protein
MKILYRFAAFIAVGLLGWLGLVVHDRALEKRLRDELAIAKRDTVIRIMGDSLRARDTVYLRGRTVFREVAANPASTKADVVMACTEALRRCDVVRATNDSLRDSLTAQVSALRKLKAKKPPRLSLYGSALYDFVNGGALGRAGVDLRLLGPLSVTGEIEAAPQSDYSFKSRAVAGLRFTFR